MTEQRPFDDINALIASMPDGNDENAASVLNEIQQTARGLAPLGHMDRGVIWLSRWQAGHSPSVDRPLIAVFAGSHGVSDRIFGNSDPDIAQQRVKSLTEGSAAVRGIASALETAFKIYELGLEFPSDDFTEKPSLSERDCAAAIAFGMEVVAEGADILVLGNAGYGSATAAAGIARGIYGGTADYWAGGYGSSAEKRIEAVELGASLHKDRLNNPLEVLRCFGGRDIAGLVGAIIAARHQSIPVILDGFVTCAAAAVLHEIDPSAIDHCMAGHVTSEPAHQALLDRIGLVPLLDLKIGIGDGTGAAFALGALKSSVAAFKTLTAY